MSSVVSNAVFSKAFATFSKKQASDSNATAEHAYFSSNGSGATIVGTVIKVEPNGAKMVKVTLNANAFGNGADVHTFTGVLGKQLKAQVKSGDVSQSDTEISAALELPRIVSISVGIDKSQGIVPGAFVEAYGVYLNLYASPERDAEGKVVPGGKLVVRRAYSCSAMKKTGELKQAYVHKLPDVMPETTLKLVSRETLTKDGRRAFAMRINGETPFVMARLSERERSADQYSMKPAAGQAYGKCMLKGLEVQAFATVPCSGDFAKYKDTEGVEYDADANTLKIAVLIEWTVFHDQTVAMTNIADPNLLMVFFDILGRYLPISVVGVLKESETDKMKINTVVDNDRFIKYGLSGVASQAGFDAEALVELSLPIDFDTVQKLRESGAMPEAAADPTALQKSGRIECVNNATAKINLPRHRENKTFHAVAPIEGADYYEAVQALKAAGDDTIKSFLTTGAASVGGLELKLQDGGHVLGFAVTVADDDVVQEETLKTMARAFGGAVPSRKREREADDNNDEKPDDDFLPEDDDSDNAGDDDGDEEMAFDDDDDDDEEEKPAPKKKAAKAKKSGKPAAKKQRIKK